MKKVKNILVGFSVLALLVMPVVAAENGCDNDDNDMIVAELALCSTHAYNIGNTKNPSGADKGLMRDVIAMKTTVITQQMYKQYEQMESMLRRLKTQLEKAILTTSLEAKGASSGSSGGSSSSSSGGSERFESGNPNIHMAGVYDCNREISTLKVFECLNGNLTTIYNSSNNGANLTTELRKQLAKDYSVMLSSSGKTEVEEVDDAGDKYKCSQYKDLGKKKRFQKCLEILQAGIRKGYEEAQQKERQYQDNRR